jgi:hypothetical protein
MTCRDFERGWNELLDASRPGPAVTVSTSHLERSLRDHATECPACHQLAAQYQLLHRALDVWSTHPAAPVDLADRILAAAQSPATTRWGSSVRSARPVWLIGLPLATAAAAALALVFVRPAIDGRQPHRRTTVAVNHSPVVGDTRALNTALADATAATWDLARSASEPATRISLHVLDAATMPEPASVDDGSGSFSVLSYVPAAPDSTAASALLQQVGDGLASSVGPLSSTARDAFGFLLGPPLVKAKPEARQVPPAAKGA